MSESITIPFCGEAYTERSKDVSAQTCINLYPVATRGRGGEPTVVLYPTPGKLRFATVGSGPIRALREEKGRLFAVSGAGFYEIDMAGGSTLIANLVAASGRATIACDTQNLVIGYGSRGYVFNLPSNAFSQITDEDFPIQGVRNFACMDGFTLAVPNGTNRVIQSDLLAPGFYDPLAFVQVTTFGGELLGVYADTRYLYLMGRDATEVRYNSGAVPFAFDRVQNTALPVGCASIHTVCSLNNGLYWLASDMGAKAYVVALSGFTPKIVSTPALNEALERYETVSDAYAYTYREGDGLFYVLTLPTAGATWVLDASTGMWHERRSGNASFDRASCYARFAGHHLVGDTLSGDIYSMSQDILTEDGAAIIRERTSPNFTADGKMMFVHEVEIDIEAGVGTISGPGSEPLATLYVSRDGGHSWESAGTGGMGRIGERKRRLIWRMLGMGREMTLRVRISDPVRVSIIGARARVTVGTK